MLRLVTWLLVLILHQGSAGAAEIHVAVASNFYSTAKTIKTRFEAQFPHKVIYSTGATGKHYAQIINGAPYELFFAADAQRPALLEQRGLIVAGSRRSYALGKLALWQPSGLVTTDLTKVLSADYRKLAIANPKLAPYGRAALEVLGALELTATTAKRLVRGENISQAYQFVASGNAEVGLVAYSQLKENQQTDYLLVPTTRYQPIEQQLVLLKDTAAARELLDFVFTAPIAELIEQSGYGSPNGSPAGLPNGSPNGLLKD